MLLFVFQKKLPKLKSLDLFNCELTTQDGYREKVFGLLPQLKFLDGFDANDKECDDSDDEVSDDGENGADHDDGTFQRVAYQKLCSLVYVIFLLHFGDDDDDDDEPEIIEQSGENGADEDDDVSDEAEDEESSGAYEIIPLVIVFFI